MSTPEALYLDEFDGFVKAGLAARDSSTDPDSRVGGRWTLKGGVWGARRGELLWAGKDHGAPPLRFRAGVRGRYGIHVGCHTASGAANDYWGENPFGVYVRLAGEPHYTLLFCERPKRAFVDLYFKTVDLDADVEIEIGNFGAHTALDYVKLTPAPASLPVGDKELIGLCDFHDCVVKGWAMPPGFESGSAVRQHADAGFDTLVWKAYAVRCEYRTRIGERRGHAIGKLLDQYDTLAQAAETARDTGLRIFGWARISNEFDTPPEHGFSPYTPFHLDHPEMRQANRDGTLTHKLSFAFPEVRKHKVDILCEIAAYGLDGIFVDVLRHPPMATYDLPLVEAFKAKTGIDPRGLEGDGGEEWLRFRADAFTQFLRELREALDRQAGRRLPIYVRTVDQPWFNLVIGCDVEAWLREGLLDGIVFGVHCVVAECHPQRLDLSPYFAVDPGETRLAAQVWRYGSPAEAEALAAEAYQPVEEPRLQAATSRGV